MTLLAAPAHATAVTIDATFSVNGAAVRVEGTVRDARNRPVPQAPLTASYGGQPLGQTRTSNDGGFALEFTVPAALAGTRELLVQFPGQGSWEAASASAMVEVAAPASDDASPATPPPTTQLTASPDDSEPTNGAFITITGTLITPQGEPLANAGVQLFDGAGEVEEGYAITDKQGRFTSHYEIPVEAEGELALTLRFDGTGGFPPAETPVQLHVQHQAASTASPSPTPSVSTSATPMDIPSTDHAFPHASDNTAAQHTTEAAPPETNVFEGIMGWFLAAVAAVGGVTVTLAIVLATRLRRHRRADTDADAPTALLIDEVDPLDAGASLDDDPPPAAPRRAAH